MLVNTSRQSKFALCNYPASWSAITVHVDSLKTDIDEDVSIVTSCWTYTPYGDVSSGQIYADVYSDIVDSLMDLTPEPNYGALKEVLC